MSTTTLLKIGKHTYASGLFWQMFPSSNELRQESGKIADQMGFKFWISRKNQGVVQAGFADLQKLPPKVRSVAFEMAERVAQSGVDINGTRSIPQNWIGIFLSPWLRVLVLSLGSKWRHYGRLRHGRGFDAIVEKYIPMVACHGMLSLPTNQARGISVSFFRNSTFCF